MTVSLIVPFLLAGLIVTASGDACATAYRKCAFRISGADSVQTFGLPKKPDTPFTPRIISRDADLSVGLFNSLNVSAQFINNFGVAKSVSLFGKTKLSPTHFKPFRLGKKAYSGIGRQAFVSGQRKTAKGRCVRVFFAEYQILDEDENVVENVISKKDRTACVVFRT